MEESKRREIEKKLRALLKSEKPDQYGSEQITHGPCGVRVIRRRKNLPDVAIACSN